MSTEAQAFLATAEAAQLAAGIIAARHRGDTGGEQALDCSFPDDSTKAAGSLFLANLALSLLAQSDDKPVDQIATELSLHIAAIARTIPE